MVGDANLSTITINGKETTALIDSGSQVSVITENFYTKMTPKPELMSLKEFDLELKAANGTNIPYSGYIQATITSEIFDMEMETILLVAPVSESHGSAHVIIGTNIIRHMKDMCSDECPDDKWKAAFHAIHLNIGKVLATKDIMLQPNETRAVVGLLQKLHNTEAAVTEQCQIDSHGALVCPRVVSINTRGRTARVPVRLCNISARPVKIRAKQELCELQEVKVLREAPILQPSSATISTVNTETENKTKLEDMKNEYDVDLDGTDLSPEQKQEVYKLFRKWDTVFPKSKFDIGHTTAVKHSIKLTNPEPFKEPFRRVHPSSFQ
jgi:hypothetical protein